MLPWFIATGLGGLIVGLIFGVLLASALVRGHYTHTMTNQVSAPRPPPPPSRRSRGKVYPHDEGYY